MPAAPRAEFAREIRGQQHALEEGEEPQCEDELNLVGVLCNDTYDNGIQGDKELARRLEACGQVARTPLQRKTGRNTYLQTQTCLVSFSWRSVYNAAGVYPGTVNVTLCMSQYPFAGKNEWLCEPGNPVERKMWRLTKRGWWKEIL